MKIKIAPSILSADFSCLEREIKRVESAGADMIHIDVMDGHFVPNITIGPVVVKYMRRITKLPLDVHLMIKMPEKFIDDFVAAGSDIITMHIETISASRFEFQARRLERKKVKVGISLNPATPFNKIKDVLDLVDLVLVMSVNPGFSGQKFIPSVIPKIKKLRSIFTGDISVDGGVNDKVAGRLINAGANILASGSYIFGARDVKGAIERLKNAGKQ
ncbi:MAG: ribulose-phosphate 3-epimerase [Candidatus Omnitrophica bacterium]|nr:ribulose-phosphate 3-epimerase [Candidatus Omnitrophota bacterium]